MIKNRADYKFYLSEDFKQINKNNLCFPSLILRWLLGEEVPRMMLYMWVLRNLEYYTNCRIIILGKIMSLFFEIWHRRQQFKYGVHIHKNICGYGLRIVHIGGIYLNAKSIGNYCTVTQQVVLGNKNTQEDRPIIGNNVELTLGCKVIGNVIIGDNVVVCPNSVVIKDIQSNCIASGVPISILKENKKSNQNNSYDAL